MSKRKRKPRKPDAARAGAGGGGKRPQGGKGGKDGKGGQHKKGEKDEKGEKGKKKPKSAARNFAETIVFVVVLVLVIRWLGIEAFKIPSSSMEPALIGNPHHGDRVLAWKPSVYLSTPPRWSVVVFVKRPDPYEREKGETTDRNFIKRVVGLPRERILLAGGDVFTLSPDGADYEIARKPKDVQEKVWLPVYESEFDRGLGGPARWQPDGSPGGGLAYDSDKGVLSGRADGTAWARFAFNKYEADGRHGPDRGLVTNLYLREQRVKAVCPGCSTRFRADLSTSRTRVRCPNAECARVLDALRDNLLASEIVGLECPRPACGRGILESGGRLKDGLCPHCGLDIRGSELERALAVPGRYPRRRGEEEAVSDLRVSFEARAVKARGFALVEIAFTGFRGGETPRPGGSRYVARVPLGGGEARLAGPHLPDGGVAGGPVAAFEPGAPVRISFAHVDQSVALEVDGREVAFRMNGREATRVEYDAGWKARAGGPKANSVRLGLEGAEASLERIRIERDLHYIVKGNADLVEFYSAERSKWQAVPVRRRMSDQPGSGAGDAVRTRKLGAEEFLMFGDNSPSSYDSRMWGPVKEGDFVGRAFLLFWPPNRMGWMP